MKASAIFELAAIQLNDADHTRWPLSELAKWLNEGVRAIVLAKPSASSRSVVIQLVRGTLQTIDTDVADDEPRPFQLLDITRNLKDETSDTREGGRTIRPTTRSQLDSQAPDWHNPSVVKFQREVRQFAFDEENPLEYFVYPGNTGDGRIEAVLSFIPVPVAADEDADQDELETWEIEVGLPELYSVPLLDYVLFRSHGKDDTAADAGRSGFHYQAFAAAVGIKVQAEKASSPNARKP